MSNNQGKTVLITGASSGIGLAVAERFAKEGYTVLAAARHPEKADELNALIKEYPDHVHAKKLDVTDTEENIKRAIQAMGPIDILINNAGAGLLGPGHATTDAERRWVFDLNVFGLLNVTYAVLDGMIPRGTGKIISLSSIVGPLPDSRQAAYSATKAAVEHFMAVLKEDLHQIPGCNIAVANIHPGAVRTKFAASAPNGTRFNDDNNPYPQTKPQREEWDRIMGNGRPVSDVVETIMRVVNDENPNFWNPTNPGVTEYFERVFKDVTGNHLLVK